MVQNPFDSLLMNQYLEDRYAEDESDVRRLLDEAEQWMVVNEEASAVEGSHAWPS